MAESLPVRVLFASSEVAPFAKTGGLADVAGALPRHLAQAGHDVRVVMPLYDRVRDGGFDLRYMQDWAQIAISLGKRNVGFSVWEAQLPGSDARVYLVDCPPLYHRGSMYTSDPDEYLRFLVLTRAALEICQRLGFAPEIIHANDWETALLPLYLRSVYAWDRLFTETKTVFTIHNLGYQGNFPAEVSEDLDLAGASYLLHQDQLKQGRLNFLAHGIMYADAVTTVSPTYAWEIQTPEMGMGLDGLLRHRAHDLIGILNGIDPREWNPRTDTHIPFHFSEKSLWRKEKDKEHLLTSVGLSYEKGVPVVGIVSRLTSQKGIELVAQAMPWFLERADIRFVALGSGEHRFEEMLASIQKRFPAQVFFYRGYHNPLAHLIEAGADIFLMPSRYEPCGLNQMYSLAYGTAPVVRKTGGLADTVTHFDPETGEGTGFVFEHYRGEGLAGALGEALRTHTNRKAWQQLQRNAMAENNTWARRTSEYEALYRSLAAGTAAKPA